MYVHGVGGVVIISILLHQGAVIFSNFSREGNVLHSQQGGYVLQTLFPKRSDGRDIALAVSLHCFLFADCRPANFLVN